MSDLAQWPLVAVRPPTGPAGGMLAGNYPNPGLAPAPINAVSLTVAMAAPTGVQATDSANLQAAHDALPAAGGTIEMRHTEGTPYVIQGVAFSKPVHLKGQGYPDTDFTVCAGTLLTCPSGTATAITSTANGCQFTKFGLQNTAGATPTAGAGIAITGGGRGNHYDVRIKGFFIDLDIQQGYEWSISQESVFIDPVSIGLRIQDIALPDGGDPSVGGWCIAGPNNLAPHACVQWLSGGGVKLGKLKINARGGAVATYGVEVIPGAGVATSIIEMEGCSLENWGTAGLHISEAGGGAVTLIIVTGNEIASAANGADCIRIDPAAAGLIGTVIVDDNILYAPTAGIGLYARNISDLHWGDNHTRGTATPLDIDSTVTNFTSVMPGPAHIVGADGGATAFASDWAQNGTFRKLAYWIEGNHVFLDGMIFAGTAKANGAAIFTLPAAYRPATAFYESVHAYIDGGAALRVDIVPGTGVVQLGGAGVAGLVAVLIKGSFRIDGQ